jgi:flagellar export protein FliJ
MSRRRFQFRLEPIRVLRKDAEESVMKELAGELAAADQLRAELSRLETTLRQAQRPPEGLVTARELADRQLYVERLERDVAEARARCARQEGFVEQTRLRLADATRKRRMLDQLEGRRRALHDAEVRRIEAAEGHEMSLLNHLRSQGAS